VFEGDPEPLTVASSDPAAGAAIAADAPLRVVFDRYLDPGMGWDQAATLQSGDLAVGADVAYDPAGPALVVVPRLALRPGLGYRLTLSADVIRGIDGSKLDDDVEIGFATTPAAGRPAPAPVDFDADLAPLFADRCGCHGPEPKVYPPLTRDALLSLPARRDPHLPLVAPGAPLRSLLVLKLLPGYPGILGEAMPPDHALSGDAIRQVVAWVASLR
jgi:hypothetical protein